MPDYEVFEQLQEGLIFRESIKNNRIQSGIHPLAIHKAGIWLVGIIKVNGRLEIKGLSEKNTGLKKEEIAEYLNRTVWNPGLKNLTPVNCRIEVLAILDTVKE